MFPLPPLAAAALIALAALLATYLPRPPWLIAVLAGARRAPPIAWLVIGAVLGPLLGVLDASLLDGLTPVVACAIGWIVAGAAARLTAPPGPARGPWSAAHGVGLVAAFVLPAALLYGGMRFLPPTLAPVWKPVWPVIAVLAASVAPAAAPRARAGAATAWSLVVTAGALLALIPHAHLNDLPAIVRWLGFTLGGAFVCGLVATRLGRQPKTRAAATITALCLAAGIGLASETSPYLVCGLLGLALAKWSPGYERLADELAPTAATVAALLWFAAGALAGGRYPYALVAAALLALWPAVRRRFAPAPATRQTLGLALALSYALTAERTLGVMERGALVTAAALALLVTSLVPARGPAPAPLTSPTPASEVTA